MSKLAPIPTPAKIRWQRMQVQLLPTLTMVFCAVVAWRLWHAAPRLTTIGQVNVENTFVRSPTAGTIVDLEPGKEVHLFDPVQTGQVIGRVEQQSGQWLDVVAPNTGQIVEIHRQVGQLVNSGQLVYTIASDHGHHVTSYLRADVAAQPSPGAPVDLRPRSNPGRSFRATVERIGPQFQPIPAAQRRDSRIVEWGLPVIISVPDNAPLRPGELVNVSWLQGPRALGAEESSSSAAPAISANVTAVGG